MSTNSEPSNHVVLYVKGGKTGTTLGACPFCQRMNMIVKLKAEGGALTYDLEIVDSTRPSKEFRKFANRLPVLKHGEEVLSDNDEIVDYLEANFPDPGLKFDNPLANAVCLEVFSKFSFYIKQVSQSAEHMNAEMWRINDYLDQAGTKFLAGDKISNLDTLMLPKLQHIRVAAKAFRNYEMPESMTGTWRYLKNAYELKVFRESCPSDQEIVHHWSSKPEVTPLPADKQRYYCTDSEPRYSMSVPDGI
ncbi:chloride intracellular channel exl-1-like [Liolophura sinensis]|uniref:chloride intracellular channel exl-1-like n=1 Tax=Liolophura sinensis TaxID=3198878 RepID=UPI0031597A8D